MHYLVAWTTALPFHKFVQKQIFHSQDSSLWFVQLRDRRHCHCALPPQCKCLGPLKPHQSRNQWQHCTSYRSLHRTRSRGPGILQAWPVSFPSPGRPHARSWLQSVLGGGRLSISLFGLCLAHPKFDSSLPISSENKMLFDAFIWSTNHWITPLTE